METKELTNALIKSKLTDAMVLKGSFYNIDEVKTPGIYKGGGNSCSGTYPNFGSEWGYGALEVITARGERLIQRLTSETGDCAQRCWVTGQTSYWTGWKRLTS